MIEKEYLGGWLSKRDGRWMIRVVNTPSHKEWVTIKTWMGEETPWFVMFYLLGLIHGFLILRMIL